MKEKQRTISAIMQLIIIGAAIPLLLLQTKEIETPLIILFLTIILIWIILAASTIIELTVNEKETIRFKRIETLLKNAKLANIAYENNKTEKK